MKKKAKRKGKAKKTKKRKGGKRKVLTDKEKEEVQEMFRESLTFD